MTDEVQQPLTCRLSRESNCAIPVAFVRVSGRLGVMNNSTADQPKDIQTTMVYTHVLTRGGRGVHSRLDRLQKASSADVGGIIRTHRSA